MCNFNISRTTTGDSLLNCSIVFPKIFEKLSVNCQDPSNACISISCIITEERHVYIYIQCIMLIQLKIISFCPLPILSLLCLQKYYLCILIFTFFYCLCEDITNDFCNVQSNISMNGAFCLGGKRSLNNYTLLIYKKQKMSILVEYD